MNPPTILVVDDEPHLVFMLASKLQDNGATVITAANGQQALDLAKSAHPDLILTDFQMPVMTGIELARQLKACAETSSIPVLMLTARGHRLSPTEVAATNIRQLIAKPFSARELVATISEYCPLPGLADGNAQAA